MRGKLFRILLLVVLACSACVLLVAVFACVGCSGTASEDVAESSSVPAVQGNDYTISVDAYKLGDAIPDTVGTVGGSISATSTWPFAAQTIDDLDTHSTHIVTFTIQKREFFAYRGYALTKLDVVINESIRGEYNPGDIITVIQTGGYVSAADYVAEFGEQYGQGIPKDEWATTFCEWPLGDQPFPEVGEEYLYFLGPSPGFTGCYKPLNDLEGIFKKDADGRFMRNNPIAAGYVPIEEDTPERIQVLNSFTLEELYKYFPK